MTPDLVRTLGRVVPLVVLATICLPPVAAAQGPTGKLDGIVQDSLTASPVPGARIAIRGTAFQARTDSSGYYFINGIPAGSYDVRVTAEGRSGVEFRGVRIRSGHTHTRNVTLPAAIRVVYLPPTPPIRATPVPAKDLSQVYPDRGLPGRYVDGIPVIGRGTVSGVVRDQHRRPVPHARVILVGSARTATADSTGRYRFEDIAAGTYTVRAAYPGYKATELQGLRVKSRQEVTQDFTLEEREVDIEDPLFRRIDYRVSP